MLIRPATIADLPAITAIVADAYTPYIARIGQRPGPMQDDYAAAIAERVVWVASLDAAVAGVVVLLAHNDHLLLDNVAVAPMLHGRGIGKALMRFAAEQAARLGLPEMRLYTHEMMTENRAMYARLGWQETGRGEQQGFRRVFFSKSVSQASP